MDCSPSGSSVYGILRQRAVHQMTYYLQFTQSRSQCPCGGSYDPLEDQEVMLSLKELPVGARRMLPFIPAHGGSLVNT